MPQDLATTNNNSKIKPHLMNNPKMEKEAWLKQEEMASKELK